MAGQLAIVVAAGPEQGRKKIPDRGFFLFSNKNLHI
jgi:hypothetical protein